MNWIKRASTAVCTYYGKFPVPQLRLQVHVRGGEGVHHGVTYPSDNGGLIRISVGPLPLRRPGYGLDAHPRDDPPGVSLHGRKPSLDRRRHLGVRRANRTRASRPTLRREDVERRAPRYAARRTRSPAIRVSTTRDTWGRTYWGGAMFCLMADVRIREQTHNRKGLQDALRGILNSAETSPRTGRLSKLSPQATKLRELTCSPTSITRCAISPHPSI